MGNNFLMNHIFTLNATFCTVVVGHKGENHWIHPDELESYVELHRNADDADAWGVKAIENARAIFGKDKVRAWTGGIPQVFGTCTENDVKNLFYPDFVNWAGTRLEKTSTSHPQLISHMKF